MNDETHTGAVDLVQMAVTLGRIEEKLNSMSGREDKVDGRLERLETGQNNLASEMALIKAAQKPKAPWYVVMGGIAGIGSLIITGFGLLAILNKVAEVLP